MRSFRSIAFEGEAVLPTDPWRWRWLMAERIAAHLEQRFGVQACYLIGSTKNACAGPASDLDLVIHLRADEVERAALRAWLAGWSQLLGLVNALWTGHATPELLDVHLITDEDIRQGTSYAVRIGAVTDPARRLGLTPTTRG